MTNIFVRISKANKEKNISELQKCLVDSLFEEKDTEATAMAARILEEIGHSHGMVKQVILEAVEKYQEEKDYHILIDIANDLTDYVKDYLTPEFLRAR